MVRRIEPEKEMVKLDRQPVMEMAKIGTFGTKVGETGNYVVWIYDEEGDGIPHFHIVNREKNFSCCVKILECDYFKHSGKDDILNSKLRKNLVAFLTSKHKYLPVTNWDYLCAAWNDNNSNYEIPIPTKMPDYTKLRD